MTSQAQTLIDSLSTNELLVKFNELTQSAVKRFSDRATAEKRFLKAIDEKQTTLEVVLGIAPSVADVEVDEHARRSQAIAETWKDPEVAAKRVVRHHVVVGGHEFPSVRAAFEALGLPESKHIPFRQILKANHEATFKFGKKSFDFKLVVND